MSLETAIAENTTTMRELINALSQYATIVGQQTHDPDPKPASVEATPAPLLPESETKLAVAEVKPEPAQEQEPIPSEQEAIRCLMDLAKRDRTRAVAILAQFSVSKASELRDDQRAEFIAAVNLKLNELEDK